jgi:nucleoside diphosphate kinase
MAIEQTLILIKPDGAFRRLTGLTIDRLDATGITYVDQKEGILLLTGDKIIKIVE